MKKSQILNRKSVLFALLTFAFSACSPKEVKPLIPNAEIQKYPTDDPELKKSSAAMHHYLMGQLSLSQQDIPDALTNLAHASELIETHSAGLHGQLAQLYLQSERMEEARNELNKALALEPTNEQFLLLMAGVCDTLGDTNCAIESYNKLLNAHPESLEGHVLLAGIYAKAQNFDDAIATLKKLQGHKEYSNLALYYLGHIYELQGDTKQAEKEYLKVYRSAEKNSNIVADILRLYLKNDQGDKALKFCNTVLKTKPNNVTALRTKAQLLIRQEKFNEALKVLSKLANIENDPTNTYFKIALVYIQQQKFGEAEGYLDKILESNPNNNEAKYYLASVYASQEQYKNAITKLLEIDSPEELKFKARNYAVFLARSSDDHESIITALRDMYEVRPNDEQIAMRLVLALRENKLYDEGIKIIKKHISDSPKSLDWWIQYAYTLSLQGKIDKACKKMEKVLELAPENSEALNFVAYANAEEGKNLKESLEMVNKALNETPDNGYYLDTRAWIYYKLKQYNEAKQDIEAAIKTINNDITIKTHHAKILSALGEKTTAKKILQEVVEMTPESDDDKKALTDAIQELKKIESGE